ncbi:MAG: hypothetical protein K2X38_14900, partial [Gemmataceae bacterium]|nr:hypothetical protein [Gemmataceae bacterium]
MATFRWIRGVLRKTNADAAAAAKPHGKRTHLQLDAMEPRLVMAQNVWIPQRMDPTPGVDSSRQVFQLFRPVTDQLLPPLQASEVTVSGSVSLNNAGSYRINVLETGYDQGNSFTLSFSGTVTFSLNQSGSLGTAGWGLNSSTLSQTADLAWSFTESEPDGDLLASTTGYSAFTTIALGTAIVDAYFAKGFNWAPLADELLIVNGVNLASVYAKYFTVDETDGEESYALTVAGQRLVAGIGQQALPNQLQTGVQSYAYTLESNFTYVNAGTNTFSLYEQGTWSLGIWAMDSVAYSETGYDPLDPLLGYGFTFQESGSLVQTGTGSRSGSDQAGGGSFSPRLGPAGQATSGGASSAQTVSQSFQFVNVVLFDYVESGSGVGYDLSQTGTFAQSTFRFADVEFDAVGAGSYALDLTGTNDSSGNYTLTESTDGLQSASQFFRETRRQGSGAFTESAAFTRAEAGSGNFSISNRGRSESARFEFSTATFVASTAGQFSYALADDYDSTTSGTFVQQGTGVPGAEPPGAFASGSTLPNVQVAGVYRQVGSSNSSFTQFGTFANDVTLAGVMGNSVYSLSCYVLDSRQSGTYSSTASNASTEIGTATSLGSGTSSDPSGGISLWAAEHSYSFASSYDSLRTAVGSASQATYQAGAYGNGKFSLTSAVYSQSSTGQWTANGSADSYSSGNFSSTADTTRQTSGYQGLSIETTNVLSNGTFSSGYGETFSQSGSDSLQMGQSGFFGDTGFAFSLGTILYQATGSSYGTSTVEGWNDYTSLVTTTKSVWSNQSVIGPFGPADASTGTTPALARIFHCDWRLAAKCRWGVEDRDSGV